MSAVGRSGLRAVLFFAFGATVSVASCGEVPVGTCTGRRPSLSTDVVPGPFNSCVGSGCHGYNGAQSAYDTLVNVPATRDLCNPGMLLVDPGNVAGSYLINKLTGEGMCPGTARMPPDPLPDAQIQLVVEWICSGAPNN